MAAPLALLLPVIFSSLWSGVVTCCRWLVNHAHIVKIVGVCILITTAFKVGRILYNSSVLAITQYLNNIDANAPQSGGFSLEILSKVNYCLPVSEMLALLAVYVTIAGLCLGLKMAIAAWKAIPFKSA